MPILTRAEFDLIMAYINQHRDELIEVDRSVEEYHQKKMAEQRARGGIFAPPEDLTQDEWLARLREKMKKRQAENNREGHPG